MSNNENELILTLFPNTSGMGYVIGESPKEIINYGIARIRPLTKDKYIKRLHHFVRVYKPSILLLRDYTHAGKSMSKRVAKTINTFEEEAKKLSLTVYRYSRDDIKNVFEEFGDNTKYGISKTISNWYPELKSKMPSVRKYPYPEHYQAGLFDAFSLMLTHHYLK